jgi:hypothetical protein
VAFAAFHLVLLALTEALSVGHLLTPGPTAAGWAVLTAVTAGLVVRGGGLGWAAAWLQGAGIGRTVRALTSRPVVLLAVSVVVAYGAALILTALWFEPNNADSLAYHLTRVAHWAQEGSIGHFATHYTAQLELAPLHELDLLHLHLLAGTDRLDGFVQLAAYTVCSAAAAEVARQLGARAEVQALAALIAAVTPSLVLEATSTQNNVFAAAVGMAAVLLALAWEPIRSPALAAALLGATVALVLLSKGTAVLLLGPTLAALVVRAAIAEATRSSWRATSRGLVHAGAVAGIAAVLVAGPFTYRNLDLFGSATGPITRNTRTEEVSPAGASANTIRNLALHFRMGDGGDGVDSVTSRLALSALRRAYERTGVPPGDLRFEFVPSPDPFEERDYSQLQRNEDYGGSPWLVLLTVGATPILLVRAWRGDGRKRAAALLVLSSAAGFVVFSAATRWTPYGSRYQVVLLVLAAPLVAIALASLHRHVVRAIALVLVVAGLPALLDSWARPLLDRPAYADDLAPYVAPRPESELIFARPADFVAVRDAVHTSGCTEVGVGNWILFEYLLWVGLDHVGWEGRIEHVDVENPSRALEDTGFEPCAVVRDRAWNGPVEPLEGMVEVEIGGLVLSMAPAFADGRQPVNPAS